MPSADAPQVLILGAGVNGCAVARELILNGVPVCLVDSADIATGATAKSSRLIHGGLRYLEYGEFDLVRESIDERTRLLRLAPHYVEPLRLFIPAANRTGGFLNATRRFFGWAASRAQRNSARGLWLIRLGLWLYDLYARDRSLPKHRTHHVGDPETPKVDPRAYRWLVSYSDAQMLYPERFVLALLEDARRLASEQQIDFRVLNYHEARMQGASAEIYQHKTSSGPVLRFEPIALVNATGAWGDRTLEQLGVPSKRLFGGTKGSHFLTRSQRLKRALGGQAVYAEAADGRLVFVLPAGESVLVGTTDEPFEQSPDQAVASQQELDYLLGMVNNVFSEVNLSREDIESHYSGVRPLPFSKNSAPGEITRRHRIEETRFGGVPVFTLVGGKLTTCRALAEATVDQILDRLGRDRTAHSRDRMIPGGESYPEDSDALETEWQRLAKQYETCVEEIQAVSKLIGTRTAEVFASFSTHNTGRLDGTFLPIAFARWVIRHEWVTTLEDLVERRLMLLSHPRLSRRCLEQLAQLLVEEGGLEKHETAECVKATRAHLRRCYGKRLVKSDATLDVSPSDPGAEESTGAPGEKDR